MEYESISYLSYQKKSELIGLENGIQLNRQTVYYHESTYANSFITQKEEDLQKILKGCKSNLVEYITMMKSIYIKTERLLFD